MSPLSSGARLVSWPMSSAVLPVPEVGPSRDRLSAQVWRDLAAEYLVQLGSGLVSAAARADAERLRDVFRGQTTAYGHPDTPLGGLIAGDRVQSWPVGVMWTVKPVAEPYASADDMFEAFEAGGELLVSNMFCDAHPVFSAADNVRFRVWHDMGHIEHGLGFSPNDELELFGRQGAGLIAQGHRGAARALFGAARALFSESVYQLAASVVLDDFPPTQTVAELGPVGRQVFRSLTGSEY